MFEKYSCKIIINIIHINFFGYAFLYYVLQYAYIYYMRYIYNNMLHKINKVHLKMFLLKMFKK